MPVARKSLWGEYRQQSRWNKFSAWSGIASIFGLLFSMYALYDGRRTSLQLNNIAGQVTHEGSLLPGHQADPPSSCSSLTPEGAMRLYLGDVVFVVIGATPTVALKIHEKPVLTLRRTDLGITVSATAWSADGSLIAEIRDNSFTVNPNNSFRLSRSGESDLTVYDQRGAIALRTEILNEHSIRIAGVFHPEGASTVVVTDDKLEMNGERLLSKVCLQVPASPNITIINLP